MVKKNCNNCKAYSIYSKCLLGVDIMPDKWYNGTIISYKPLSECPKPLTNKKFMEEMNDKIKRII